MKEKFGSPSQGNYSKEGRGRTGSTAGRGMEGMQRTKGSKNKE